MSEFDPKPLNWTPDPNIGYSVERRADGGLNVTFNNINHATIQHWREFALAHLENSDRLTRNRYDLRAIHDLPHEAIDYALEVNTDPSVRNIRLAVVVVDAQVAQAVREIVALSTGGVELAVFHELEAAEAWLSRPLTLVV